MPGLQRCLNAFWDHAKSCVGSRSAAAQDDLAKRAEQLKNRVADLNRQLMKLEEDTLAPVDTQVVVFLAIDQDTDFELDAVELKLDDTLATHYLYSTQERGALKRSGVQRLYMGALSEGGHRSAGRVQWAQQWRSLFP